MKNILVRPKTNGEKMESYSFNHDFVLICTHQYSPAVAVGGAAPDLQLDAPHGRCKMLFTFVVQCRLISFSWLVTKLLQQMWVVSAQMKVSDVGHSEK